MPKDKPFRELQFSSAQLIVVFLAILVLGVFIFLLGISVGKKQTQLAAGAGIGPGPKTETVAAKVPLPADAAPAAGRGAPVIGAATEAPEPGAKVPPALKPETSAAATKSEEPNPASSQPVPKPAAKTKAADVKPAADDVKKSALKTAEAPKGRFYIQVGAVTDKSAAQGFADRVSKLGFPAAVIDPLATDRKAIFRVRIGPFETIIEADGAQGKVAQALRRKKTDFFIVKD
jgi:cell division septation protein DedD